MYALEALLYKCTYMLQVQTDWLFIIYEVSRYYLKDGANCGLFEAASVFAKRNSYCIGVKCLD